MQHPVFTFLWFLLLKRSDKWIKIDVSSWLIPIDNLQWQLLRNWPLFCLIRRSAARCALWHPTVEHAPRSEAIRKINNDSLYMANISPVVLPLCHEQEREMYWSIGRGGDVFSNFICFFLSQCSLLFSVSFPYLKKFVMTRKYRLNVNVLILC